MDNPLIVNRRYFLYYLFAWITVIVLHAGILYIYFGAGLIVAVTDSLIFNATFAFLGLSSWFMVRFMQAGARKLLYLFLNYLVVAFLVSVFWVSICSYILSRIFPGQTDYQFILETGIYGRLIAGFFFYLVIIMFYYLVIYYQSIQEKAAAEVKLNTMIQEAKLDVLKSQMNPHFIFNSLNSVSSLIITSPEKARDMVIKLASFLRYSLEQDSRTTSTLGEELNNIDNYLAIEKIRFGDRLEYFYNIDKECISCTLPALILQPLFENAIKHGVYKSAGRISINMNVSLEDDMLQLILRNNFDEETQTRVNSAGIGLANIKNRLELLYHRKDLFSLQKSNNTFEISLCIPQKT
ncbi:MAG: sensor histidine kinase [Bacteroidales bacterium]